MFEYLSSHLVLKDRNCLNVFNISTVGNSDNFDSKNFSRWVLLDGKIRTPKFNAEGIIACVTNQEFSVEGEGLVIDTLGFHVNETKFAMIEKNQKGHLYYIDGCSNTNLIDPFRNGDPCLNYLFFPKNTKQSEHTHPSVRIGFVIGGSGVAVIKGEKKTLSAGDKFILDRFSPHYFLTENNSMSLIVFHPDSEDGPKDETNPMISRTFIK